MSLHQYKKASAELREAKEFLALIGKPQRTTAKGVGKLHQIVTEVTIYHQETDGSRNYHRDNAFEKAFAHEVESRFAEIKAAALARMEEKVREAREAAKEEFKMLFGEEMEAPKEETAQ